MPTVETGIALSIVYAAAIAVVANDTARRTQAQLFTVTLLIGLLHGLGFSFVLHEILKIDAPDIWQSLLAFNFGVEIGQVIIILTMWPLLRLLAHACPNIWQVGRCVIALGCAGIATFWAGERALSIFGA